MNIKNQIILGAITLTAALGFIGCGNSSQTADKLPLLDVSEDGKTLYANFDKTDTGTAAGSGITIDEGEYLIIDSGITEGAVQVKVTAGGDDINEVPSSDNPATIDYEFSSVGTTEYQEIAPGNYTVFVETTEKTTGTITFSVVAIPNAEEANETDYVFMGGLYISDPHNDLTFNMYRTSDGDLVTFITKLGDRIYGEFTTEDATLDDGREYTKLLIDGHEFGYHFALDNETDDNFLVDDDGTVYFAKDVDEGVAMENLEYYLNQGN